jgi:hypothetical protein
MVIMERLRRLFRTFAPSRKGTLPKRVVRQMRKDMDRTLRKHGMRLIRDAAKHRGNMKGDRHECGRPEKIQADPSGGSTG